MALSLDGNISYIGTEFIKLLNTGSSDLATVQYVDDAIAEGGGGGNVDLSNYYTRTETDNLLNNKLNVNNPQDIIGNLRLDPTNGLSKIIINAVSPPNANDDFYCNGSGQFNGTLRVSVLTSDGDINANGCNADTFNSHIITNDIVFKHNNVEYMRFNATDDTIDLSKELNLGSSTLKINSLNTNGLNDMTFSVDTLGEFLRFNISDFTVRVPNNRSFLSQNIFTDIIKPLAFSNDISLQGKNSTSDGYEEYVKINSTTETVDFSKSVNYDEGLIMKLNKVFYLDNTSNKQRYIYAFEQGATSVLGIGNQRDDGTNGQVRIINGTSGETTSLLIDKSFVYTPRQIQGNNGLKVDFIDTRTTTADFDFRRNNVSYMTFYSDRVDINQELHLADALIIDVANKLTMRPSLENGVNIFDIRNLHPVVDNPMIRFRVGELGGESIVCEMSNNAVSFQRNVIVGTAYELRTNAIDTSDDNDLVFRRNDVQFLALDKFTEDTIEKEAIICSKQLRANGNLAIRNLQINQFLVGIEYCDFRLENVDSVMRFFVGNGTNANLTITNAGLTLNRISSCNGGIKTNTIDTVTDTDLIFRRNGVEYFRLDDLTGTDILNVANDKGVSASYVFGNRFWNRSFSSDTTFFGSNVAGDDRVEYMKWNYLSQSVDYNAPIDNTGLAITGNIIDTTVSDERLKTNIEDVDTDFTSCIKNVKVKTFEYKDDKYKTNDNYGFIAQELKEHLPKECKNIVKENKVKNEDETFLSINYMKLSVVLWKCCQEQQSKIEHLEASMYEIINEIKELKGKKTTKPKVKAKSKAKAENK